MLWTNKSFGPVLSPRRVLSIGTLPAALVFILACLLPASIPASDFRVTETFTFGWYGDNRDDMTLNDDYFDFKNRLNLTVVQEIIEASIRLDTITIFDYDLHDPGAPPGKTYRDDYRIERLTGILKPVSDLKLTCGDFYAQLGNGILLSLRKINEFGMETVLRGAKVDYASRYVSFALMGGVTNINNVDEQNNYFFEDPMDRIMGGRISFTPVRRLKIETHGLMLNWKETVRQEPVSPFLYGGGLLVGANILPGKLTAGAEFDMVWREKISQELVEGVPRLVSRYNRGEAAYLKLHGIMGPVSVLLEGKWFEDFDVSGSMLGDMPVAYNLPPSAERVDQEVFSNITVYGGRLKTDVRLSDDFSIYANVSGGDYAPLTDVAAGEDVKRIACYIHTYGGFNMFFNEGLSQVSISGGWRREMEPDVLDEENDWLWHKHIYHAEAKVLFYIREGWSFHYSLLHESMGERKAIEYVKYARGTQIIGFDLSGVMSLSAAFEYDTELLKKPFKKNLYGWWEGKFYPAKGLVLVAKGGLERGGLKCVSGLCRRFPPFTGFKLDVIYRY